MLKKLKAVCIREWPCGRDWVCIRERKETGRETLGEGGNTYLKKHRCPRKRKGGREADEDYVLDGHWIGLVMGMQPK